MKKRITLLGIIVAVLTFLQVPSVAAFDTNFAFKLVPDPIYDVLRRILIQFGTNPGEEFIIFTKFVILIMLFAVFYYATKRFENNRVRTVVSLSLALFSVILIPGQFLLRMTQLYAGIVGLLLPLLLIFFGMRMYKEVDNPLFKVIIDMLAIIVIIFTVGAVNESPDLFFLTTAIQWFGLLILFFVIMLLVHGFELLNWVNDQSKYKAGSGEGWFDKMGKFVKGSDKKGAKESKDLERTTEAMAKLEEHELQFLRLERTHATDALGRLEKIFEVVNELRTIGNQIDSKGGSTELTDRYRQLLGFTSTELVKVLGFFRNMLTREQFFKKDLDKEVALDQKAEEILTKLQADIRNVDRALNMYRDRQVGMHAANQGWNPGDRNITNLKRQADSHLRPLQAELQELLKQLRDTTAGGVVGFIEEHKRALQKNINELLKAEKMVRSVYSASDLSWGKKADMIYNTVVPIFQDAKRRLAEESRIEQINGVHRKVLEKIKGVEEEQRTFWSAIEKNFEDQEKKIHEQNSKILSDIDAMITTVLENHKGRGRMTVNTYSATEEGLAVRQLRGLGINIGGHGGFMSMADFRRRMIRIGLGLGMTRV